MEIVFAIIIIASLFTLALKSDSEGDIKGFLISMIGFLSCAAYVLMQIVRLNIY